MTFKRLLTPFLIVGVILTIGNVAYAQNSTVTCGLAAAATTDPIGPYAAVNGGTAIPTTDIVSIAGVALQGPSANAASTGHTEVASAGPTRMPLTPGGGAIRVWCANPGPATGTVNPGVIVLQITFTAPLASTAATATTASFPGGNGIRITNGSGVFVPGTNVGISSATGSSIIIGLGTPVTTGTANPNTGINFTTGSVSTFDIDGVLLDTNGKAGEIDAALTEPSGTANLTATNVPVISTIAAGLVDPSVPTSIPSQVVAAVGVAGYSATSGGPAQINSQGLAVKGSFTIKLQEGFPSMWQSSAQYNGGAVFPATASSSTQVLFTFNNVPAGLSISGCKAVLTDVTGTTTTNSPAGAAVVSQNTITAASNTITVNFSQPMDLANTDVLWLVCTNVSATAGSALPSTAVTVQAELAPLGASGQLTGLATGLTPRYQDAKQPTTPLPVILFPPAATNLLVTYAVVIPGSFNTGIAVSNTTTDVFGTANGGATATPGTITFTMYPATGSPFTFTSPSVASGTSFAANVSSMLPTGTSSFLGYIFVQANFPQAHGAATIYNTADGEAALSTPVLVVAAAGGNIGVGNPRVSPESLGQ